MSNKQFLGDLMRQAQALQGQMAKIQEDAAKKTVEASSGGGMVTVKVNGKNELLSIVLEPEVVKSSDLEMLQDLIIAAVNEGLRRSRDMMSEEMKGLTGGLQIPGLM